MKLNISFQLSEKNKLCLFVKADLQYGHQKTHYITREASVATWVFGGTETEADPLTAEIAGQIIHVLLLFLFPTVGVTAEAELR